MENVANNLERFVIPEFKVDTFEERADKIQKKADKVGIPFVYSTSNDLQRTTVTVNGHKMEVEGREVVVAGTKEVAIEGFDLVCKVEFHKGGNILKGRGVSDQVFEGFKDSEPTRCDHCGHKRHRKEAFIVTDGDEYKQVGSSCLKDFTGHKDAVSLAETYSDVVQFIDSAANPMFEGVSINFYRTEEVLAIACKQIRLNGYKKSSECPSTKDGIIEMYTDTTIDQSEYPDKRDWEKAREIIKWAESIEPTNSYMNNIKILCQTDGLRKKDLGIVVSAPIAYDRETREKKDFSDSSWVGEEGERLEDITAEVVFTKTIDKSRCGTPYNDTFHIMKFLTEDGNVLVWFTSSCPFFNIDDEDGVKINGGADSVARGMEGDSVQVSITELDGIEDLTVNIRCTVKEHTEYEGTKQTKVSRVYFEGSDSVDHFEKV